jgi:hypothetical protein
MKVVSSLAALEFRFGTIERRGCRLIVHSHVDQPMKTTVYVSPRDALAVLGRLLASPGAWLFIISLPICCLRERLQQGKQPRGISRGGWNTPDGED